MAKKERKRIVLSNIYMTFHLIEQVHSISNVNLSRNFYFFNTQPLFQVFCPKLVLQSNTPVDEIVIVTFVLDTYYIMSETELLLYKTHKLCAL